MPDKTAWRDFLGKHGWLGLGLFVVVITRVIGLPKTLWEYDEFLFAESILKFDPVRHHPHPPGYPLLVGLGKLVNLVVGDPFTSLVTLAFLSTIVAFVALAVAFRNLLEQALPGRDDNAAARDSARLGGVLAALLVMLAPAALVHTVLPMSDPPALMFLALTIWLASLPSDDWSDGRALSLGVVASAAIGCRPQLVVAVVPTLLVVLAQTRSWRARMLAAASSVIVCLAWFAPLLVALGGLGKLVAYQRAQALYAATHDADLSRAASSMADLVLRFAAHPWGTKLLSLPVLGAAAVGSAVLLRRRVGRVLPLATLAAANLALCIVVMDPADGARYSLPTLPFVGLAAIVGIARCVERFERRGDVVLAMFVTAFAAGALAYAWPLLSVRRTTASPPVQACETVRQNLRKGSVIFFELSLRPHAEYLLHDYTLVPVPTGWADASLRLDTPICLIADRPDSKAGSARFEWPNADVYGKLTRNHYRVVSVVPEEARTQYQALSGIFPFERDERGAEWRWLGPEAVLRVAGFAPGWLRTRIELDRFAPFTMNRVIAMVGEREVAACEAHRGTAANLDIPLVAAGPIEVTLRSELSYVPSELGLNRDRRRLAVKLLGVEQRALPR